MKLLGAALILCGAALQCHALLGARRQERAALRELSAYVQGFSSIDPWMRAAAVDGKNGGPYLRRWELLIEQIEGTCRCGETLVEEQFAKKDYKNGEYVCTIVFHS